ncbi:hypothetical protein PROFUN_14479 [Planoprotostelium fungivorum]|uniref:START domain-containing protein n=1 Tax=Planoprotostelium fungivorum TaxID=1890364 RepID=A0A2P6MZZ4_9EUKA|nr:hypothetical protein PROFUN_14479 [Planoprotostelium fungivorum]
MRHHHHGNEAQPQIPLEELRTKWLSSANDTLSRFQKLASDQTLSWETIVSDKVPFHVGSNKDVFITKSTTVINAPPLTLIEIIADGNRRFEYDELFDGKDNIETLQDQGPGNRITLSYTKLKSPAHMVAARDFCVITVSHYDPSTGCGLFVSNSVEHPNVPLSPNHTRAELTDTGYLLVPVNGGTATSVTYLTQMDPKGWLPTRVMNKTAKQQGQSLVKLAKYIASLPKTH